MAVKTLKFVLRRHVWFNVWGADVDGVPVKFELLDQFLTVVIPCK